MKNLRKISLGILFICLAITGFGQNSDEKKISKEKIAAIKVGYITDKLNLSETEAGLFWPVYNQEKAELDALRSKEKKEVKLKEMSEEDLEKQIYQKLDEQQKRLDIQRSYIPKYIKIIGVKKVALLLKAEQGFKKEMLQKLKNDPKESKTSSTE